MKHVFVTICFALAAFSASAQGIPSPKDYSDTLDLMYGFLVDHPAITSVEITDDEGLEVVLPNGYVLTLYPDNLTNYMQAAESDLARQDVVDGHMNSLMDTIAELGQEKTGFSLTQVLPVLRRTGYLSVGDEETEFFSSDFPGDLTVYYAIDYPDKVEFLSADVLAETDFTEDQARAAAAENLRGLFDNMQIETHQELNISWILLDGYYESSLALATELWANAANDYEKLIMIVPNRDYMVFGEGADPQVYEALSAIANDVEAQFNGAMTNQIYRWSDKGWVLD